MVALRLFLLSLDRAAIQYGPGEDEDEDGDGNPFFSYICKVNSSRDGQ